MSPTSTVETRARTMWTTRLHSAVRTSLACSIVAGATLYGPKPLVDQLRFPSFSYLTIVLIAFDATLGDAVRGCWHALLATAQVVPVAVLARRALGPAGYNGLSISAAALAAAVGSFLVVVPEGTHVTAKRIALGQIVLVCTDAVFSTDGGCEGFVHPLHLAASTGLGASASLLAVLVPFPLLAHFQVRKLCRLYAENAIERMNLYLEAFGAEDPNVKTDLIRQAKPVAETGAKLLQSIRVIEEGMPWEAPWRIYSGKAKTPSPSEKLLPIELAMKGIEYSLISSSSSVYQFQVVDQENMSNFLQGISCKIHEKLEKESVSFSPFHTTTTPLKLSPPVDANNSTAARKYCWVSFFFSCIDALLEVGHGSRNPPRKHQNEHREGKFSIKKSLENWFRNLRSSKKLETAFKSSISLGLAVFFGLIYDRENACWGGLSIAISFGTGQQPIFTISNRRALGTAIGSVYGVICCLIARHLRPVALLPWVVVASFLRHSRMYGHPGGISAAIGALLILGRKLNGSPHEFAVERLTVVYIGLTCFIAVELCMQPKRAAALARSRMYMTLCAARDCLIRMTKGEKHECVREKLKRLEALVHELEDFVANADSEPEFWYLPFQTLCYQRLLKSFSNVVNLINFTASNTEKMVEMRESGVELGEFREQMDGEMQVLEEKLSSLAKCVAKSDLNKSRVGVEIYRGDEFFDVEGGELGTREKANGSSIGGVEWRRFEEGASEERVLRCLRTAVFCVDSLRKEIGEIEMHVKEIVRWENYKTYLN